MKKVASIFAIVVMAMGMFSCDNDRADNDVYDTNISSYNDDNLASNSGGSGGE